MIFKDCCFQSVTSPDFSLHFMRWWWGQKMFVIINAEGRLMPATAAQGWLPQFPGIFPRCPHQPRLCSAAEQNNDGRKLNNFNPAANCCLFLDGAGTDPGMRRVSRRIITIITTAFGQQQLRCFCPMAVFDFWLCLVQMRMKAPDWLIWAPSSVISLPGVAVSHIKVSGGMLSWQISPAQPSHLACPGSHLLRLVSAHPQYGGWIIKYTQTRSLSVYSHQIHNVHNCLWYCRGVTAIACCQSSVWCQMWPLISVSRLWPHGAS